MKKIGIVHLTGNIGGASISCYNLVETLKNNYEVVVFCPAEPTGFSDFLRMRGIKVINFINPLGGIYHYSGGPITISPAFLKNIIYIYKYRISIANQIKTENLDLLIVNSKVNAWLSSVANKLRIPSICFVRETKIGSYFNIWNVLDRFFLNKFSAVSFLSQYDLDKLKLKNTTIVIPDYLKINNYIQMESREDACRRYGIPRSTFNILYVGGYSKLKGIDVIIKSLKYLSEYDITLVIAGRKEFSYKKSKNPLMWANNLLKKYYENMIKHEIEKYQLKDNIVKIGIQNEMSSVYTVADIVVFPANKPHQARPAFEAGVQCKPIIISNFDNIKEFVINDYNGLYFERRNPKALAKVIQKLINSPKKMEIIGRNNYNNVNKRHNNEIINCKLINLIEEIT